MARSTRTPIQAALLGLAAGLVFIAAPASAAEPVPARYSLAQAADWSPGFKQTVKSAGGGMLLTAAPAMKTRQVPRLARGSDGALWAFERNQLGKLGADGFTAIPLAEFDAALQAVAPIEGGAILLGSKGRENVLARVGLDGKVAWRKTGPADPSTADPTTLKGIYRRLSADFDGAVWLYATRQAGQIAKVDIETGAISVAVTLDGFKSASAWVVGGMVFCAMPAAKGAIDWTRQPVAGGDASTVAVTDAMGRALTAAIPLPDGGALVRPQADLVRMTAKGEAAGVLAIAGIVRDGADLVVAVRSGDDLELTRWSGGKAASSVKLAGLGSRARLASAGDDGYGVLDGRTNSKAGKLVQFDAKGARTGEQALAGKDAMVLEMTGRVDLSRALVEPDGSLLVPGADAQGAFVVRAALP